MSNKFARWMMATGIGASLAMTSVAVLAGPAWGPPGWQNGPLDPSPPPRPEKRERTPGDDAKLNPRQDPDVRRGINDYCSNHHGGVCK